MYTGGQLRSVQSLRIIGLKTIAMALLAGGVCVLGNSTVCFANPKGPKGDQIIFSMVPSAGAATCLPDASARVRVRSLGPVEEMTVHVSGLPPRTEFDFFVIQVPKAPFGLSWYQGDIETNEHGDGTGRFVGRFSIETFIVAPGTAPAPQVHDVDDDSNPATHPVHTFHLGLWFNSPADAVDAGCPGATTPFNGDHTAGIQVLNTSNFPDLDGPLRQLVP